MTCPNCGDTGTVSRPVGVGDLMGTERCECAGEPCKTCGIPGVVTIYEAGQKAGEIPFPCGHELETCQMCGGTQKVPYTTAAYPELSVPGPCPDCAQPAPKHSPASEPVSYAAVNQWMEAFKEQVDKGLATYGGPLMTFNGLNQADMCRKELVDANNYLTALEMERNHLASLLRRALPYIDHAPIVGSLELYEAIEAALEGLNDNP